MSPQELTFITNENNKSLLDKFNTLIPKYTKQFDTIVGYFYISGFYKIYKSLENVDKIRILVGLNVDKKIAETIINEKGLGFESNKQIKENTTRIIQEEVEKADDSKDVEDGIKTFIEWLQSGKMEIRIYTKAPLHAKVYIMTFKDGDRDPGMVITGSSNLTAGGLDGNLEFNVQLRDPRDYRFALDKFEELWKESIEITDQYIDTIKNKTHLSDEVTPYELYLKFLYEYFKNDLNNQFQDENELPGGYLDLDYQRQAVVNAQRIVEEFGGVFISDVVGLGKTFITTRLIKSLNQRTLVIAPPSLLDENNPGSWPNVFDEFGIRHRKFESLGKLDHILRNELDKNIDVVVIDESHRFRNQSTDTYNQLAEICKGKKVVLVSATPFNNTPSDLLSQIKLFQNSRKSSIPGVPDLDNFFSKLNGRLKGLDRKSDYEDYMLTVTENAKEIREKILKFLMVRRTRNEIRKYYETDLSKQSLKFPDVADPTAIYYELDELEETVFDQTISFIKAFKYSRYSPMLYYKGDITQQIKQGQKNMTTFMKMLLVKRFESSIYAFKKTLDRFINSYEVMISEYIKGFVYVSNDSANTLFELLSDQDEEKLLDLIERGKAEKYDASEFETNLLDYLKYDLEILKKVASSWDKIKRDVKLDTFIDLLKENKTLKNNKLLIFTESKETANYLYENINKTFPNIVLNYTGSSSANQRYEVITNFDAKSKKQDDNYRILVTTDVLAEGVNLHRSNCVINYDIPWNPTRMIQRVGRINRVDTKFKEIFTYNFFPTTQANDILKLRESAEAKINMFIELLGNDARLLTEGEEIKSHDLFNKLLSKKTITGEDEDFESELKYLQVIKEVRDLNIMLFDRIKKLPKKSRVGKIFIYNQNALLTYFQKGNIDKFIISNNNMPEELGFFDAIKIMESDIKEKRRNITDDYYELIEKNKLLFEQLVSQNDEDQTIKRGGDSAQKIVKRLRIMLKDKNQLTEEQEIYLQKVVEKTEEGALSRGIAKKIWDLIKNKSLGVEVYSIIKSNLSDNWLKNTYIQDSKSGEGRNEVILSLMLFPK